MIEHIAALSSGGTSAWAKSPPYPPPPTPPATLTPSAIYALVAALDNAPPCPEHGRQARIVETATGHVWCGWCGWVAKAPGLEPRHDGETTEGRAC